MSVKFFNTAFLVWWERQVPGIIWLLFWIRPMEKETRAVNIDLGEENNGAIGD